MYGTTYGKILHCVLQEIEIGLSSGYSNFDFRKKILLQGGPSEDFVLKCLRHRHNIQVMPN